MADLIRFGRRVPLPSTVQIIHDLLSIERNEKAQTPHGSKDAQSGADPETRPPAATRQFPTQD